MQGTAAKKALILKLMRGFPSSQDRITESVVASYLEAVAEVTIEALDRSVTQFITGRVEDRNNSYLPSAAELSANARSWNDALASLEAIRQDKQRLLSFPVGKPIPPPLKPLGPIKMEIEGIMRDTSEWTYEEKEYALRTGTMPESRNLAGISQAPRARLQKMSE